MSINSPLSALEHLRALCVASRADQTAIGHWVPGAPPDSFRAAVLETVERGLELYASKPRVTPAMYAADRLLEAAIAHEADLTSRFREYIGLDAEPSDYAQENPLAAELIELRALLEPLRPPKPASAEELAEKLAWAIRTLETYAQTGPFTPELNKARAVLARAPK
jgi:hypothetical protein